MLLLVGCGSADCAEHAAQFVADLIAERLVLAYKKGVLSGGREFPRPGDLTHKARRGFAWVTSWQGTYDWQKKRPRPDCSKRGWAIPPLPPMTGVSRRGIKRMRA